MRKIKITEEEIEKKIIDIKKNEVFQAMENTKISKVKKDYFRLQADRKLDVPRKNLIYNIKHLMHTHNINVYQLHQMVFDKTGVWDRQNFACKILTEDFYHVGNIVHYSMLFGFTFNISYLDILFYQLDYLEKKKSCSKF
jgi:hypothetical protein